MVFVISGYYVKFFVTIIYNFIYEFNIISYAIMETKCKKKCVILWIVWIIWPDGLF